MIAAVIVAAVVVGVLFVALGLCRVSGDCSRREDEIDE